MRKTTNLKVNVWKKFSKLKRKKVNKQKRFKSETYTNMTTSVTESKIAEE